MPVQKIAGGNVAADFFLAPGWGVCYDKGRNHGYGSDDYDIQI